MSVSELRRSGDWCRRLWGWARPTGIRIAGGLLIACRGHLAGHIARAALESIAFQVADVLEAVQSENNSAGGSACDGGAAVNNLMMQFQADLLGRAVVRRR